MIHPAIDFALTLVAFLGLISTIVNSVKLVTRRCTRSGPP